MIFLKPLRSRGGVTPGSNPGPPGSIIDAIAAFDLDDVAGRGRRAVVGHGAEPGISGR